MQIIYPIAIGKRQLTAGGGRKQREARIAADVCRVHRSLMVAPDRIETVEKDRIRISAVLIPASDSYRDRFYELIGSRT